MKRHHLLLRALIIVKMPSLMVQRYFTVICTRDSKFQLFCIQFNKNFAILGHNSCSSIRVEEKQIKLMHFGRVALFQFKVVKNVGVLRMPWKLVVLMLLGRNCQCFNIWCVPVHCTLPLLHVSLESIFLKPVNFKDMNHTEVGILLSFALSDISDTNYALHG